MVATRPVAPSTTHCAINSHGAPTDRRRRARPPRRTWSIAVALLITATACGSDETTPPPPAVPTPPTLPAEPPPTDPLEIELARRVEQFAANMDPATPAFHGSLATSASQDFAAVLQPGRCFRIVAVGGTGVEDLDLFLFDENGVQVQQDTATDAYPVLGLAHPVCPAQAGTYRVQVKMFAGSGDFVVRVLQSRL